MSDRMSEASKERMRNLSRKMAILDRNSAIRAAEQRGRAEGETLILHRILMRRFGDLPIWATEKLHNASAAQRESWLEKVLDAPDLDAFFK